MTFVTFTSFCLILIVINSFIDGQCTNKYTTCFSEKRFVHCAQSDVPFTKSRPLDSKVFENLLSSNIPLDCLEKVLKDYNLSTVNLKRVKIGRSFTNNSNFLWTLKNLTVIKLTAVQIDVIKANMLPINLTELFIENYPNSIEQYAFSATKYLESLFIIRNNLNSLPKSIFANLTSIGVISLAFNNLSDIEDLFNNLAILRKVDLSNNKIEFITAETFLGCIQLKVIDLSSNRIKSINKYAFLTNIRLQMIQLNRNSDPLDLNLTFGFFEKHSSKIETQLYLWISEFKLDSIDLKGLDVIDKLYINLLNVDLSNTTFNIQTPESCRLNIEAGYSVKHFSTMTRLLKIPNLYSLGVDNCPLLKDYNLTKTGSESLQILFINFSKMYNLNLIELFKSFPKLKEIYVGDHLINSCYTVIGDIGKTTGNKISLTWQNRTIYCSEDRLLEPEKTSQFIEKDSMDWGSF